MAMVIVLLLGAPLIYLGIQTATRDPVLNSLAGLPVPAWAAQSPDDRILGSRWCFIDCRFRERRMVSDRDPEQTNQAYHQALQDAGWNRWRVEGCPLVEVEGSYSCWTRDEYTLDLWVHLPPCAYDPRNLRPDVDDEPSDPPATAGPGAEECTGAVVEIKMQNRVADERGLPAGPGGGPAGPTAPATAGEPTPSTTGNSTATP